MRANRWLIVLGVLFVLSLIACSGGGGGGGGVDTGSYRLSVTGSPSNARVYLNGTLVPDPRNITLTPGTHQIRVEITLDNGQILAQTFIVHAGAQTSIVYNLERYTIEVTPSNPEVWVDQEIQLTATMKDGNGAPVSASWRWTSANPNIATVGDTGRVRGVQAGSTRIVVTDANTGYSIEVPLVVKPKPTHNYRIEISPNPVEVWVDQEIQLTATMRDENNNIVEASWTWTSANPNIATVSPTGRVRGIQMGSTTITVTDTRIGLSAEVPVVVKDFPPPPR